LATPREIAALHVVALSMYSNVRGYGAYTVTATLYIFILLFFGFHITVYQIVEFRLAQEQLEYPDT
jgi:hypothetical protein